MARFVDALVIFTLITLVGMVVPGCNSDTGIISPQTTSSVDSPLSINGDNITPDHDGASVTAHRIMSYSQITFDPSDNSFEIVPLRESSIHLNVLILLEGGLCSNCFKIVGFTFPEPGVLNVDIEIKHPIPDMDLSVFDMRGIIMFNGSHAFPDSGKIISDPALGDGALLNADGYTALYNGSTIGAPAGDFQKYYPGHFSTPDIPSATINGYLRHNTDNPANTRNAFYAGDAVTRTYSLKMPTVGVFTLGYAVDANWAPAISTPVDDPISDFGPEANCPEPWKVVVTEVPIGNGLTNQGGQTQLLIDVYDWQGYATHHNPVVECPELFDGALPATWYSNSFDYASYDVTISNTKLAAIGDYKCLIGVEANENNPTGSPWLDLTAYNFLTLTVVEDMTGDPVAIASADPNPQAVNLPVSFSAEGSFDPDGGIITLVEWDWDDNGTYDETGANIDHTWASPGTYLVQLRVTDDESQTDTLAAPLEINISSSTGSGNLVWAKSAGGASGNEYGYGITSLPNNSTIVSGWFEGSATFGAGEPNETVLSSGGFVDIFIAKYSPDGELAWAKRAGGGDDARAYGITRLSDDSTVITGWFEGVAVFGLGDPNQTVLFATGSREIFVARYNTDGTLEWAKRTIGSFGSDNYGQGITDFVDDSVVVTGWFEGNVTFGPGDPNQTILTSAGGIDMFVARYDEFGALVWAKSAGGAENDLSYAISKSGGVAVVVTGYYSGTATFGAGESGEDIITSEGNTDMFIARFDVNGETAWASSAGGPSGDMGYAITVTDFSTVVTGSFMESATFGTGTVLTSDGGSDTFIASYNVSGNLNWAKSVGAPYDDYGRGITTLYLDNSTVITGQFAGTATFGPGEPNQTVLTAAGWDMFVARYDTDGTLVWAKYAEGASGTDEGWGITALQDNSTVVTGYFVGSDTFGPGEPNQTILTSAGNKDLFIARFDK